MTTLTVRRTAPVYVDGVRGLWLSFSLFAVFMIVAFGLIGAFVYVTGRFEDAGWQSVWEQSMYGSRYFPLSMGMVLLAAHLPVATAHGVSRTSFLLGAAGVMVTFAAAIAAFVAVGQVIEYLLFDAAGAMQELTSPHLFTSGREVGLVFTEMVIVVTANVVGGFFIASVYYRWRWRRATLALPLLLLPIAAVEALMAAGWPGDVMSGVLGVDRGPLGVVIPASIGVIVATLALALAVLRRTDVRTSSG